MPTINNLVDGEKKILYKNIWNLFRIFILINYSKLTCMVSNIAKSSSYLLTQEVAEFLKTQPLNVQVRELLEFIEKGNTIDNRDIYVKNFKELLNDIKEATIYSYKQDVTSGDTAESITEVKVDYICKLPKYTNKF
jgi:hypothetical protein